MRTEVGQGTAPMGWTRLMLWLSKGCRAGGVRSVLPGGARWDLRRTRSAVTEPSPLTQSVAGSLGTWARWRAEGNSPVCSAVQRSACWLPVGTRARWAVHVCSPDNTYSLLLVPFFSVSTSQFLIASLVLFFCIYVTLVPVTVCGLFKSDVDNLM